MKTQLVSSSKIVKGIHYKKSVGGGPPVLHFQSIQEWYVETLPDGFEHVRLNFTTYDKSHNKNL